MSAGSHGEFECLRAGWQARSPERSPGGTFIGRLVDAAAERRKLRDLRRRHPHASPLKGSVQHVWIRHVLYDARYARVRVLVKNALPAFTAVNRAIDPARGVGGAAGMCSADRSHQNNVGILRINDHGVDVARLLEASVVPGFPRVSRLVDALARCERPTGWVARADVDNVGIGRRCRDRADGGHMYVIEDGAPGGSTAGCLPHSGLRRADVIRGRIAWDSRD